MSSITGEGGLFYKHAIKMIKLSVIGTRDFEDGELLEVELNKENIDVMVVGGKAGPDTLCSEYAVARDIPLQVFLPDYRSHGASANYQRNLEMIHHSNRILIFWNGYTQGQFNYLPHIKRKGTSFRTIIY